MQRVGSVSSGTNQVADPDDMYPGLFFCVGVLHQLDLGLSTQALDVGDLDKVVDALSVVLEVET